MKKNEQLLENVTPGSLYGRQWRVLVQTENTMALDVTDLRCTFTINANATGQPTTCHLMIYNLSAETEANIIKEGYYLTIEAGYAEQYGTVFKGDIIQVFRNREDGINYRLELIAIDGAQFLQLNYIRSTVAAGSDPRTVAEHVARVSNTSIEVENISEQMDKSKLVRPKILFGSPTDYLDDICKNNSSFYWVQGGKLFLRRYSDPVPPNFCIELTPSTGLVGTPEYTDQGINIKMLLNPKVQLHGMIKINNEIIGRSAINLPGANGGSAKIPSQNSVFDSDGEYQVYSLIHSGDTHGDVWTTEVVGIGRNGTAALPLMVDNASQDVRG